MEVNLKSTDLTFDVSSDTVDNKVQGYNIASAKAKQPKRHKGAKREEMCSGNAVKHLLKQRLTFIVLEDLN